MSRPVDRWDYDGDCPACFAGEPHTLEAHDAVLAETAVEEARMRGEAIACAISFQAGISVEEARRFVAEGS